MTVNENLESRMSSIAKLALVAGLGAMLLCVAGGFRNPTQFFRSYLLGYIFWLGVALGSLAILMLHHLVGGNWGFAIRRMPTNSQIAIPSTISAATRTAQPPAVVSDSAPVRISATLAATQVESPTRIAMALRWLIAWRVAVK